MMVYVLVAAIALGGFFGWRITSWAYDADYKTQVEQVASDYEAKRKASEAQIRAQLSREQKTRIVYRTIKEAANEITVNECLDDHALSVWNKATASANAPEANQSDGPLRAAAHALGRKIKGGAAQSH